jgi:hypothetical protein
MPALAPARADPRQRFGQAVVALYTRYGGGAHRPCLDPPRGAPVSRAAVAPASGGVSTQGVGSDTVRRPEQTTCVHTPGVEGVIKDERATEMP